MAVGSSDNARQMVIRALREDGRASFTRIAAEVGIARHQVASLVQSAVSEGELRLTVSISPALMGLERFAYLQIAVSGPAHDAREALVSMRETTFVADIAGHYSIDAEVRVRPDPHLRETLDAILQLPGVRDVRATLYESIEVNRFSPLHTAKAPIRIDAADGSIIRHLQKDARATFRELGHAAGLSSSGARIRYERLIQTGAIKVVGIPVRGGQPQTPTLGLGIRAGVPVNELLPRVKALDPEFLAVTIGAYDLIATMSANSAQELVDAMELLRATEGLAEMDCWANLKIAKEQYGESDSLSVSK